MDWMLGKGSLLSWTNQPSQGRVRQDWREQRTDQTCQCCMVLPLMLAVRGQGESKELEVRVAHGRGGGGGEGDETGHTSATSYIPWCRSQCRTCSWCCHQSEVGVWGGKEGTNWTHQFYPKCMGCNRCSPMISGVLGLGVGHKGKKKNSHTNFTPSEENAVGSVTNQGNGGSNKKRLDETGHASLTWYSPWCRL